MYDSITYKYETLLNQLYTNKTSTKDYGIDYIFYLYHKSIKLLTYLRKKNLSMCTIFHCIQLSRKENRQYKHMSF